MSGAEQCCAEPYGLRVQHAEIRDLNEKVLTLILTAGQSSVCEHLRINQEVCAHLAKATPLAVLSVISCGVPVVCISEMVAGDLLEAGPSRWRRPQQETETSASLAELNLHALLLVQRVATASPLLAGMMFGISTDDAERILHTRMAVLLEYAPKVTDILSLRMGRRNDYWKYQLKGGCVDNGRGELLCRNMALLSIDASQATTCEGVTG